MKKGLLFVLPILLTGCSTKTHAVLYLDEKLSFEYKNTTFEFSAPTAVKYFSDYELDISLTVTSKNPNPTVFSYKTPVVYREKDNAVYMMTRPISYEGYRDVSLRCEISETFRFSTNIPNDFKEEKYRIEIDAKNLKISIHLYDEPWEY